MIRTCRSASGPGMPRRSTRCSRRRIGAASHLGHARQQPQLHVRTRRHACGWPRLCAGRDNPAFCKTGSDHPSAKLFPMERAARHLAMFDPKTKKYTFVDTCYWTHHPQFGFDANDTLWTSGGGPVVGWLNTKMFDADRRRREIAGLDGADPRHQRQRQARRLCRARSTGRSDEGQTHQSPASTRSCRARSTARLGIVPRNPGARRAPRSRIEPAGNRARRDLQRARAGLRRARRRHRQQGRRVGVAGQRTPRQLRSPQVQGAAERAEGDRRPLPGRLDASTSILDRASRASATTAPSRAITPGSISTTRSDSAKTCRCPRATSTTG